MISEIIKWFRSLIKKNKQVSHFAVPEVSWEIQISTDNGKSFGKIGFLKDDEPFPGVMND